MFKNIEKIKENINVALGPEIYGHLLPDNILIDLEKTINITIDNDIAFDNIIYDNYLKFNPWYYREFDYFIRDIYTRIFGFAFISESFVIDLCNYIRNRKVLEVLSGTGFLAHHLQNNGLSVIPTDNMSWMDNGVKTVKWSKNALFTNVEEIDAVEAVKKYGKDVDIVLMSWPEYTCSVASDVLKAMRNVNPDLIMIYIGEWYNGCTADEEFFDILESADDGNECLLNQNYKSFYGIRDQVYLIK